LPQVPKGWNIAAMKTPAPKTKAPSKKPTTTKKAGLVTSVKRFKVDWEAVERDYRTAKFTLRELEAKHHVSYAEISRRAKKHQWKKDLSEIIRQATSAALLQDSVTQAQKDITETVLVAVEVNTRVILGHRRDISDTRDVAAALLSELRSAALLAEHQELLAQLLAGTGAEPIDVARARATVSKALTINSRISSVKQLSDTFDKLQLAERRAFAISDGAQDGNPEGRQKRVVLEFVDVEPK